MKIIKNLSANERFILFMAVNNPPGKEKEFEKEEWKRRRPLWLAVMEGANVNLPNVDFTHVDMHDLELSADNYIILLDCIEKTRFPSMMDGEILLKIKEKVLNGESIKSA